MRRDLSFGLAWFGALFALDGLSSLPELRSALGKIVPDDDAVWIARREVGIYLAHMASAYLVMGLYAGLVLFLLNRAVRGGAPQRRSLAFAGLVTLWMLLRGAILWPLMFNGLPGQRWLSARVDPGAVTALALLVGGLLLARALRRHGARPLWLGAFALSLAGASLADRQPRADTAQKNEGLNVIIFSVDALRPDHLASFGYERNTAPGLEQALSRMSVFESAFTPEARTWEAWMSVLTGTYPATHGQRWSLPQPGREQPAVPMLTEALREAGYHTRFLTDDSRFSYMLPKHGFDVIEQPTLGFRTFAASRLQPNFRAFFTWLNGPLGWAIAPAYRHNQAYGITYRPDAFAELAGQQVAEASRHGRFFLAIHTCPLHTPADRPWPYHTMYGMGDYTGKNRYRYRSYGSDLVDGLGRGISLASERRGSQQNLNLYDAGIAMADDIWAGVSRALDEGELWDNTLVILMSDHGEDFLEDSTRYHFTAPNHGFHPWGIGQQRVVMAIGGPGFTPGRRAELASLVDLAPTIAAATGVSLPSAEGVALQQPVPERVLFGETGVGEPSYWAKGHRSVPFKSAQRRYTLDPETARAYQRPEFDEITVSAKDRWAFDDRYWLIQEPWEDGTHRYSMYLWREDPTFAIDVLGLYPEAAQRLYTALQARPRFPGQPEIVEDIFQNRRPVQADAERAEPSTGLDP